MATSDVAIADHGSHFELSAHGEALGAKPVDIAGAWQEDDNRSESYFFNNVLHGIRTSEDGRIWEHLESSKATWLLRTSAEMDPHVAPAGRTPTLA